MVVRKNKTRPCTAAACSVVDISSTVYASNGSWTFDGTGYTATTDGAWILFDPPIGGNGILPWYVEVTCVITHGAGALPEVFIVGGASTTAASGQIGTFDYDNSQWRHGNLTGFKTPRGGVGCSYSSFGPLAAGTKTVLLNFMYDGICPYTLANSSSTNFRLGSTSSYSIAGGRVGFGITTASGCSFRFSALEGRYSQSACFTQCTPIAAAVPCFSPVPKDMLVEIPTGVATGWGGTYTAVNCLPEQSLWYYTKTFFQDLKTYVGNQEFNYPGTEGYVSVVIEIYGSLGVLLAQWVGSRGTLPCDQWTDWISCPNTFGGSGTTARIKLA